MIITANVILDTAKDSQLKAYAPEPVQQKREMEALARLMAHVIQMTVYVALALAMANTEMGRSVTMTANVRAGTAEEEVFVLVPVQQGKGLMQVAVQMMR